MYSLIFTFKSRGIPLLISGLLFACSNANPKKSPAPKPDAPAAERTKTSSPTEILSPTHISTGIQVVIKDKNTQCAISGPHEGELSGEPIGEPLEFNAAARKCVALGKACSGISTEWYSGFPYQLMKAKITFKAQSDSYGRTYLNDCSRTQP